jgi:serine/threonine-protein kinase
MPRYVLERRIGDGGMAEVFRAHREGPEGFVRACAVKRLLPELRREHNLQLRFIDEARIAGRLHHPCIVDVSDFYEEGGVHHLVMELVDGVSAEALVEASARGRFIPIGVTNAIVLATARALQHAHTNGVLHRDVSACNVLLSIEGDIKLTDFGLADAVGRLAATEPGSVAGKLAYLSPSRKRGEPATARDDLFALGILLQRLLASANPRDRARGSGPKLSALQLELVSASAAPDCSQVIDRLRSMGPATPEDVGVVVRESRGTSPRAP